jgi:hypothetical protein
VHDTRRVSDLGDFYEASLSLLEIDYVPDGGEVLQNQKISLYAGMQVEIMDIHRL